MTQNSDSNHYLPLTESTFYILLALVEPLHGYGIMQKVESISRGEVVIGPGTLYGALQAIEKEGLIEKVSEVERRKIYALTGKGRDVLKAQILRNALMHSNGQAVFEEL